MDERETFWSEPKKRRNWTPKHNLWLLCGGGWRRGWALLFFCLIAPFGGQKLEILGRGEANIFFVALEANFVLFHFSSNPHKKIRELVMDFLHFFTDKLMVSHRHFPQNLPFVKTRTDHWYSIAQFSPTPDLLLLGFITGTRSKTTKSFRWADIPPLLSSRYLLGKHLTF